MLEPPLEPTAAQAEQWLAALANGQYGPPVPCGRMLTAGQLATRCLGPWTKARKRQHTLFLRCLWAAARVVGHRHPDWEIWAPQPPFSPLTFRRRPARLRRF